MSLFQGAFRVGPGGLPAAVPATVGPAGQAWALASGRDVPASAESPAGSFHGSALRSPTSLKTVSVTGAEGQPHTCGWCCGRALVLGFAARAVVTVL